MSHNPNTIKSQSDLNPCNDGKRSSDVLVATLEKCERLQKQLDIAVKCLEIYALENLVAVSKDGSFKMEFKSGSYNRAKQALQQIEELNK
jgi:hypothetical protein